MTTVLPTKKRALLDFLKQYIERHGFAPTLTDIAKHFKVSSLATIHEHLAFLESAGFLKRKKGSAREIVIREDRTNVEHVTFTEGASIKLPLVGLITAGAPIEAIETRESLISVPQEIVGRKNAYILRVKGDSMIESLIADGDLVVVEKTDYARDGDMVVALLEDGTATLKKFYRHKNYIRLQPANRNYKPLTVRSVVIQGRVLGVIRKI